MVDARAIPLYGKVWCTCETCGGTFLAWASAVHAGKARYCGPGCVVVQKPGRKPQPRAAQGKPQAPTTYNWVTETLPPIPPICWCQVCHRRPVAAKGCYSRRCARCRARPWMPDCPAVPIQALPAHRRRTMRRRQLEREALTDLA